VRLHSEGDVINAAVTEDGIGWPTAVQPSLYDTSGRGLIVVASLTSRSGVTAEPDGRTTVW
jgi:hypothetical protein